MGVRNDQNRLKSDLLGRLKELLKRHPLPTFTPATGRLAGAVDRAHYPDMFLRLGSDPVSDKHANQQDIYLYEQRVLLWIPEVCLWR